MKYLIHILVIVGMFALFFTHPGVVEGMFGLIFGLFVLVIVFMAYASWRQKHGHPIRGG